LLYEWNFDGTFSRDAAAAADAWRRVLDLFRKQPAIAVPTGV